MKKTIMTGIPCPKLPLQIKKLTGDTPEIAVCDRSYKSPKEFMGTIILSPKKLGKTVSDYTKRKIRKLFRRRAGIEPIIGHIKNDHRMARNYLKGTRGDHINAIMAAAAFNFKKWMRKAEQALIFFFTFDIKKQKLKEIAV